MLFLGGGCVGVDFAAYRAAPSVGFGCFVSDPLTLTILLVLVFVFAVAVDDFGGHKVNQLMLLLLCRKDGVRAREDNGITSVANPILFNLDCQGFVMLAELLSLQARCRTIGDKVISGIKTLKRRVIHGLFLLIGTNPKSYSL